MSNKNPERILCAAVHYNDGKKYLYQPDNIETGCVVSGWRHHNCIILCSQLLGDSYDKTLIGRDGQGFLTSHHRFVGRKEGYKIAKANNQIWHNLIEDKEDAILTSEDLYMKPNEYGNS